MLNKKELLYQRIDKHGEELNKIFKTNIENVSLCKKLFRLENKGNRLATTHCNGVIEENDFDIEKDKIMKSVDKILNYTKLNIPVFFNSDCRGYALKIDSDYTYRVIKRDNNIMFYQDLGGYGIIAPDFRE